MMTRKRNLFNEKVDDFLILTILSTIKKRRILQQTKDLTHHVWHLPHILAPKAYQLPNQEEVHKLKDDFLQWQNEEEFDILHFSNPPKKEILIELKSILHLLHSKPGHESIFNWIWNWISILTWSINSKNSSNFLNNSSHFLIRSSSSPISINIHQIHLKPFNPSKSLSYSSNNLSRSE